MGDSSDKDNHWANLQNLALAALVALLGWNVSQTQKVAVQIAVIEERTKDFVQADLVGRIKRLEEFHDRGGL